MNFLVNIFRKLELNNICNYFITSNYSFLKELCIRVIIKDINFDLITKILEIKKIKKINNTDKCDSICLSNSDDISKLLEQWTKSNKNEEKLKNLLSNYSEDDIRLVYTFYYFNRSFLDGSISLTFSFQDCIDYHKNDSLTDIIDKINGVAYDTLVYVWNKNKLKFIEHERNVKDEKEKYLKRLRAYTKRGDNSYFQLTQGNPVKSTKETFIQEFDNMGIQSTNNIEVAKNVLLNIINATRGHLIVDFLGSENWDHFDYIENDDEVLKLYWKYSNDGVHPPHNIRVDIAFDKLELVDYGHNVGIVLKGYYRSYKEIKSYYANTEKVKKIHSIYQNEMEINETNDYYRSLFFYEIEFDKKQRGSLENFLVTFLPWRYYNILITPKHDSTSLPMSLKILIVKNLLDIDDEVKNTQKDFSICGSINEDTITMFGNRFRKILEKLLKFIVLVSGIKFEKNYEAEMIGNLLSQIKYELSKKDKVRYNNYDLNILQEIISTIEEKKVNSYTLIEKLNTCSHSNVRHKINTNIIDEIHIEIELIVKLSFKYFNLR